VDGGLVQVYVPQNRGIRNVQQMYTAPERDQQVANQSAAFIYVGAKMVKVVISIESNL